MPRSLAYKANYNSQLKTVRPPTYMNSIGAFDAVTAHREDGEGIHLEVLKLIGSCGFDALQIRDQTHEAHYRRLHRFLDTKGRAVPIVCSDAHNPDDVFSCKTGIPYAKVSSTVLSQGTPATIFDEMRSRVLRFGETRMTYGSPGRVRHWIEGIEIALDAAEAHAFWSHTHPRHDRRTKATVSR